MGAGVVWRAASLAASVSPEPLGDVAPRSRKSVARKNFPGEEVRGPWACDFGQKFGTAALIALREACSPRGSEFGSSTPPHMWRDESNRPRNMISASFPLPVLMK